MAICNCHACRFEKPEMIRLLEEAKRLLTTYDVDFGLADDIDDLLRRVAPSSQSKQE